MSSCTVSSSSQLYGLAAGVKWQSTGCSKAMWGKKVFDNVCLCLWSNMLSLANFVQKQSKTNLVMHMASFHQCPTAELIQDASQQDFSLNGLEK